MSEAFVEEPPILDRQRFDELRASCAPPVFSALVETFAENLPMMLHQMRACASRADADGMRSIAHQYRGFAGSFGARRLEAIASRIQTTEHLEPSAILEAAALIEAVGPETLGAITRAMQPDLDG